MSRKSKDIRPRCGTSPIFIGGCNNQRQTSKEGLTVLQNTTKQRYYLDPSGSFVSPYKLAEGQTAPDCSDYSTPFVCGDGINGNIYCGPPDVNDFEYSGFTFPVGSKYFNSYTPTNTTTSFSNCQSFGSKQVWAKKSWQGRYSYSSRMLGSVDSLQGYCTNCTTHNFDGSPDGTKYLSITANASKKVVTRLYEGPFGSVSGQVCCPDGSGGPPSCVDNNCTYYSFDSTDTKTGTAESSAHVDIFGNFYADTFDSSSTYADECWNFIAKANGDITDLLTAYNTERGLLPPDVVTGEGSHWRLEWWDTYECSDECGNPTGPPTPYWYLAIEITLPGRLDVYNQGKKFPKDFCDSNPPCPTIIQTRHEVYTYSGASMLWTLNATGIGSLSFDQQETSQVVGNLASPYSVSEVQNTMRSLLGEYPLDDDSLLPWNGNADNVGPLVSYDEGQAAPFLQAYTSSIQFSGRLMGLPGPRGIQSVWNPEHKNYDVCVSSNELGLCNIKYQKDWGAFSPIPPATQWVDKRDIENAPQGAFIGMNYTWTTPSGCGGETAIQIIDDIVVGCKYAEIIIPDRRSYNYARPCGVDRFEVSESLQKCVAAVVGTSLILQPDGSPFVLSNGQYVWVCGTGVVDGCWKANKTGDYALSLIECIATASVYPSGPIANCGTGMVAPLRWQLLPPAICGRVDIASATDTAPITCSLAEPQYLTNSDPIIITGAEGMPINGLWSIQVLDASNIVLVGSDGTGGKYKANTGQAYSPNAPDWRWNDNEPKHEYQILEWYFDYRDVGEYNRIVSENVEKAASFKCSINPDDPPIPCDLQELPINPRTIQSALGLNQNVYAMRSETACGIVTPCSPSIAFWSPNDDFANNTNATNFGFPSVPLDGQYGGIMWNAIVKQTDNDYLWQRAPCPCSSNSHGNYGCNEPWIQDDATCANQYPYPPQVESRAEPVEGSPALPRGVYIGCLTPDDIAAGKRNGNIYDSPDHSAVFSDDSYGPNISYEPYFIVYLAEKYCVCNGGSFSDSYSMDGISC